MAIKNREYTFGVTNFKHPKVLIDSDAIGVRLMELIMMEPGDDPLHPDMGVGLNTYRYGLDTLSKLQSRVAKQIDTYLPMYAGVSVSIIRTPDRCCNIEILINDTTYVYDSAKVSKPIHLLEDVSS